MARALVKQLNQSRKNYLINSNFDYWQRNTTFTAPAQFSYLADRWYNQSALNTGSVFQIGSNQGEFIPAGISATNYASYLYNTTAPRMNINQALEFPLVTELLGKTVTFSVYMKKNVANPRSYTIAIAKNATANTITGGSWSTIATTLIPNSSLGPVLTRFSVTATIPNDGTANGLKVMIYDNAAGTAGDFVSIAQASLNIGNFPAEYQTHGEGPEAELAACQRYYEKSYPLNIFPGTAGEFRGNNYIQKSGTGNFLFTIAFRVIKRGAPSITVYSVTSGAAGTIDENATAVAGEADEHGSTSFLVRKTSSTVDQAAYRAQWTAVAELT